MHPLRHHARRLPAVLALLACSLLSGAMTGQAAAAPTPSYSLAVSTHSNRTAAVPLAGTSYVQPAKVYIFATPSTSARSVAFYLDTGTVPYRTDTSAMFDFVGTAADGTAIALDTTTIPAGLHKITAVVTTTKGKTKSVSADFTITAAPAPPPPAPSGTPAPFPSRLVASGRKIVDENGYVLPTLRGFNMHVTPTFVWSQTHFDAIRALGATITRANVHWDHFEPSKGVISSAAIANLDTHIARAQAAGMYTVLDLHLNVGHAPSWASDVPSETEKFAVYGQTLTQYLAYRYGNPASPYYTKAVIGYGLNEPPLDDASIRDGNGSVPYLEGVQRKLISWMRAPGYAPSWIGIVAYGYGSATPIYDDTRQNPDAIDASPTAYDAVGGNVIIDLHDYKAYCLNDDPNCEGRRWNGTIDPTYQGGVMMQTSEVQSYTSSTIRQGQHAAYLKPYRTFSVQANIPLMLGEWGWVEGATGEVAWANDKKAAYTTAGTVIEIQWNYDVNVTNSEWSARPGGVWRPSTLTMFGSGA